LGEILSNWEKEIINIQKYNINNGFVEGKNNKIKVIKRLSYVLHPKSWTQDWRCSFYEQIKKRR